MQQSPENTTITEKKPAERRTIEAIVGRKPDHGDTAPANIRKIDEKLTKSGKYDDSRVSLLCLGGIGVQPRNLRQDFPCEDAPKPA
jgi:hypothetical protein